MKKRINLEEVLGFVARGEDCKVMIDDGQVDVYPANAQGYGEVVVELEAYDFEECDSVEEYVEWLNDYFKSTDTDFEIK